MKKLGLLLFLLMSVNVHSGDIHLYTGAWSYHFNDMPENKYTDEYNEDNDMIAIEYKNYMIGTFVNSYNHRNYLAAYTIESDNFLLVAGVSDNYKGDTCNSLAIKNACLALLPFVKIPKTPIIFGVMGNGAILSFRWNIKL